MKKIKLNTNIKEIKSKVDLKLDDLNNSLFKNKENLLKAIERKGFKVIGVLRNEIIISGNGLKKQRIITFKEVTLK